MKRVFKKEESREIFLKDKVYLYDRNVVSYGGNYEGRNGNKVWRR